MEYTDISVVVTIYNTQPFLERCLDSIAAQTIKPREVIMINDGSKDGSEAIAQKFAREYDYFYLLTQSNAGLSAARNKGVGIAKGKYICFIDSDDYIENDYLERLYASVIKYNADMAFADFRKVDKSEQYIEDYYGEDAYEMGIVSRERLISELFVVGANHYAVATIVMWNKLIRTDIIKTIPFREGVLHEDEFMIMPLLLKCDTVVWDSGIIYTYRQQGASITHDKDKIIERLKVLDAYEERIYLGISNGYSSMKYNMVMSYMYNLTIAYFTCADSGLKYIQNILLKLRLRAFKGIIKYKENIGRKKIFQILVFVIFPSLYRRRYY